MMPEHSAGARSVATNQEGPYKNLEQVVRKHASTRFLRPIAAHTRVSFSAADNFVTEFYKKSDTGDSPRTVVLDSGCGTGESTLHIAKRYPNVPVIGIDKSAVRLCKAGNRRQLESATGNEEIPDNVFWVRAELLDFWNLALDEVRRGRWRIPYHALYYPNPWPKGNAATRRFHLHPIFPTLLALGDTIELRTNWEIYAREFTQAAGILKGNAFCEPFSPSEPETAFERKYKEARQQLWRVLVKK
jgi:tRNA G46 methylase TrmB